MVKNSIKKNLVGYSNFARELPIKEKRLVKTQEKKEKRVFYIKTFVIIIGGLILSFITAKVIKRKSSESTLITSSI
jgi:hypothetical protein